MKEYIANPDAFAAAAAPVADAAPVAAAKGRRKKKRRNPMMTWHVYFATDARS